MISTVKCGICDNTYNVMRPQCPACGSARLFLCSHSYEPYNVVVTARNAQANGREVVRAFRTDVAFRFITAR